MSGRRSRNLRRSLLGTGVFRVEHARSDWPTGTGSFLTKRVFVANKDELNAT